MIELNKDDNYFNFKKHKIFYRIISKEKKKSFSKAVLYLHGKGDHSKYINNIIDNSKNEYIFFSFDFPGFGKSSGKRGHISSFLTYFEITEYFINNIMIKKYKIENLFLLGESLGSLIAFYTARNYFDSIIKGLIFIPGVFNIRKLENLFNLSVIFLLNVFLPSKMFKGNTPITSYTNDINYQNMLKNDPLWERDSSARLIFQIYKYMKYLNKEIENINIPVLIFEVKNDKYNNFENVKEVFKKIQNNKKNKLVVLEKSKHWLLGSEELSFIKETFYKWIDDVLELKY